MKDYGTVQGMTEQAVPLVIGVDTVYVHTEIKPIPTVDGDPVEGLYSYNEVQYDKDEYLQLTIERTCADIDYIAIMQGVTL